MANGFTAGGDTARYPSSGYPAVNFAGAGMPGRSGVPVTGSGGGAVGAVSSLIPGGGKYHQAIAVALVIGIGYALWHITSKM